MPSERSSRSDETHEGTHEAQQRPGELGAADLESLQVEKLSAIRRAVEAGDYDSAEILHLAIERMIEAVENESARTTVVHDDQPTDSV